MIFRPDIHIKYRIHNVVDLIWSIDWLLRLKREKISAFQYGRIWRLFRTTKKRNVEFLKKELRSKMVPEEYIKPLIVFTKKIDNAIAKKQDEKDFELEAKPIFAKALSHLVAYRRYLVEYRSDYMDD